MEEDGRLTHARRVEDLYRPLAADRENILVDDLSSSFVNFAGRGKGFDEIHRHSHGLSTLPRKKKSVLRGVHD